MSNFISPQMRKPSYHWFKRKIQSTYLRIYKNVSFLSGPQSVVGENDLECIKIVKELVSKEDTTLLISPISEKKYMRNEKLGISVIMSKYRVQVINHVYSYDVTLGDKAWQKVLSLFDNETESRRMRFEREIVSNVRHSFKTILTQINEQ